MFNFYTKPGVFWRFLGLWKWKIDLKWVNCKSIAARTRHTIAAFNKSVINTSSASFSITKIFCFISYKYASPYYFIGFQLEVNLPNVFIRVHIFLPVLRIYFRKISKISKSYFLTSNFVSNKAKCQILKLR